jgi:hypothetical protein
MYDFNMHISVYITGNKSILIIIITIIIVGKVSLKNAIQNLSYGDCFSISLGTFAKL